MGRKEAEEAWLHAQVGPAFDALKADPGRHCRENSHPA